MFDWPENADDIWNVVTDPSSWGQVAVDLVKSSGTVVKDAVSVVNDFIVDPIKNHSSNIANYIKGGNYLAAAWETVTGALTAPFEGFSKGLTNSDTANVLSLHEEEAYEIVNKIENTAKYVNEVASVEIKNSIKAINNVHGFEEYVYSLDVNSYEKDIDDIYEKIHKLGTDLAKKIEDAKKYSNASNATHTFATAMVLTTAYLEGRASAIEAVFDKTTRGVGVVGRVVCNIFGQTAAGESWYNWWKQPSEDQVAHSVAGIIYKHYNPYADVTSDSIFTKALRFYGGLEQNVQTYLVVDTQVRSVIPDQTIASVILGKGVGLLFLGDVDKKAGDVVDAVTNARTEPPTTVSGISHGGELQNKISEYIDSNGRIRGTEDNQQHEIVHIDTIQEPINSIKTTRNWTDLIPDEMKNRSTDDGDGNGNGGDYPSDDTSNGDTTTITDPITTPPTVPKTVPATVPTTETERPTEVITQPITQPEPITSTPTTPNTSPQPQPTPSGNNNGGGNNGGGWYSGGNNNTTTNPPTTETPTEVKFEEDVIKKGNTYKLPTSSANTTTTTTTTTSKGNSVIPVLAGLGAAAAAGIGAKAYIDRKNNRDNDEESEDFKAEDWSNNNDINIEYQEPVQQKEETLDFDDDGYNMEETEKYGARTHQELEDLQ